MKDNEQLVGTGHGAEVGDLQGLGWEARVGKGWHSGQMPITQALGNVTFMEPPDVGKSKQELGCFRFRHMYPQKPLVNYVGRTASHRLWPALGYGL